MFIETSSELIVSMMSSRPIEEEESKLILIRRNGLALLSREPTLTINLQTRVKYYNHTPEHNLQVRALAHQTPH
jgi:hypothetical protein